MYSKEIRGAWSGVQIPDWLRVFDCRNADGEAWVKTPWGSTLLGSERAQVDLGLRTAEGSHATMLLSCSTYIDARTAGEAEIGKQLRDGIKEAEKFRAEYEAAKKRRAKPGDGGSCLYMPVAFALSNFGWCIISDERTMIVRAFGKL